jgi:hypothetical protein
MSTESYTWSEGYWKVIFATSSWYDSNGANHCNQFEDWIKMVIQSMPCDRCRTHGYVYVVENPPHRAQSYLLWAKKYKQDAEH